MDVEWNPGCLVYKQNKEAGNYHLAAVNLNSTCVQYLLKHVIMFFFYCCPSSFIKKDVPHWIFLNFALVHVLPDSANLHLFDLADAHAVFTTNQTGKEMSFGSQQLNILFSL